MIKKSRNLFLGNLFENIGKVICSYHIPLLYVERSRGVQVKGRQQIANLGVIQTLDNPDRATWL